MNDTATPVEQTSTNLPANVTANVPAIASAQIGEHGIELRNMADLWSFSQRVFSSKFVPNGIETAEQAFIAIQIGLECGLSPMQALQGTAVINGRPSLFGDVAKGLVLASPVCEYLVVNPIENTKQFEDDYGWECRAKRRNHPEVVRRFTVNDAKLANLWGKKTKKGGPSVWTQYGDRMLMWRAQTYGIRDAFADVLRGIAIKEDLESQMLPLRDVTPPEAQPGGEGSQLAQLLSDPKPAVPVEAIEVSSPTEPQAEPNPQQEVSETAPEASVPVSHEVVAPAEEAKPMPLDDEGLRNLMVKAKIPKKHFEQMVMDVGMGVGIENAVISDLNDEGRQLLETAILDYKAKK